MEYARPMPLEWTSSMLAALPDDGNRYELLDGVLAVTPAPAWSHQRVTSRVYRLLDAYIEAHALGEVFFAPADVEFSPKRLLQPDIFVVPLRPDGVCAEGYKDVERLMLAVEVLSPSTARRDRGVKRDIYLDEDVAEYWIVDPDARCIERWARGAARPEIAAGQLVWRPSAIAQPLVVEVQALFRR